MPRLDRQLGGYRVFIGGVDPRVGKVDIEKEFDRFGPIVDVWVARNPPGFAFLVYKYSEDADKAVRRMDGSRPFGSSLRVEHAVNAAKGGGRQRRSRSGSRGWRGRDSRRSGSRNRRSPYDNFRRRQRSRSKSSTNQRSRDIDRDRRRSRSPSPYQSSKTLDKRASRRSKTPERAFESRRRSSRRSRSPIRSGHREASRSHEHSVSRSPGPDRRSHSRSPTCGSVEKNLRNGSGSNSPRADRLRSRSNSRTSEHRSHSLARSDHRENSAGSYGDRSQHGSDA